MNKSNFKKFRFILLLTIIFLNFCSVCVSGGNIHSEYPTGATKNVNQILQQEWSSNNQGIHELAQMIANQNGINTFDFTTTSDYILIILYTGEHLEIDDQSFIPKVKLVIFDKNKREFLQNEYLGRSLYFDYYLQKNSGIIANSISQEIHGNQVNSWIITQGILYADSDIIQDYAPYAVTTAFLIPILGSCLSAGPIGCEQGALIATTMQSVDFALSAAGTTVKYEELVKEAENRTDDADSTMNIIHKFLTSADNSQFEEIYGTIDTSRELRYIFYELKSYVGKLEKYPNIQSGRVRGMANQYFIKRGWFIVKSGVYLSSITVSSGDISRTATFASLAGAHARIAENYRSQIDQDLIEFEKNPTFDNYKTALVDATAFYDQLQITSTLIKSTLESNRDAGKLCTPRQLCVPLTDMCFFNFPVICLPGTGEFAAWSHDFLVDQGLVTSNKVNDQINTWNWSRQQASDGETNLFKKYGMLEINVADSIVEISNPAQGPTTNGSISFISDPSGADAFLDDTYIGQTPITLESIAIGYHEARIYFSEDEDYSTCVNVQQGNTTIVKVILEVGPETEFNWGYLFVSPESAELECPLPDCPFDKCSELNYPGTIESTPTSIPIPIPTTERCSILKCPKNFREIVINSNPTNAKVKVITLDKNEIQNCLKNQGGWSEDQCARFYDWPDPQDYSTTTPYCQCLKEPSTGYLFYIWSNGYHEEWLYVDKLPLIANISLRPLSSLDIWTTGKPEVYLNGQYYSYEQDFPISLFNLEPDTYNLDIIWRYSSHPTTVIYSTPMTIIKNQTAILEVNELAARRSVWNDIEDKFFIEYKVVNQFLIDCNETVLVASGNSCDPWLGEEIILFGKNKVNKITQLTIIGPNYEKKVQVPVDDNSRWEYQWKTSKINMEEGAYEVVARDATSNVTDYITIGLTDFGDSCFAFRIQKEMNIHPNFLCEDGFSTEYFSRYKDAFKTHRYVTP